MVVREDVGAPPGADDRHLEDLGQADQVRGRARPQDAGAGDDERPPAGGEAADRGAHDVGIRVGRAAADDVGDLGAVGHRLVEDVLGEGEEDRTGPAAERLAGRLGHRRRAAAPGSSTSTAWVASRPIEPARSTSWNASRPRTTRGTWPRSANIGVESALAVWIPMARLDAPTARVARAAAGRPVSWPYASAMNAAPPSWRVATTRMPAGPRASRRPRKLSPGTVNATRTPGRVERVGDEAARPSAAGIAGCGGDGSAAAGAAASSGALGGAGTARQAPCRPARPSGDAIVAVAGVDGCRGRRLVPEPVAGTAARGVAGPLHRRLVRGRLGGGLLGGSPDVGHGVSGSSGTGAGTDSSSSRSRPITRWRSSLLFAGDADRVALDLRLDPAGTRRG